MNGKGNLDRQLWQRSASQKEETVVVSSTICLCPLSLPSWWCGRSVGGLGSGLSLSFCRRVCVCVCVCSFSPSPSSSPFFLHSLVTHSHRSKGVLVLIPASCVSVLHVLCTTCVCMCVNDNMHDLYICIDMLLIF